MPNAYIELIDSLILQRQALKISQRELASAAGVSWTEVALMEQKKHMVQLRALLRIASRAKLQTGGRECRIKILPYNAKFGRIKTNCNMRFGCCHNGGRFSPQIHFGVPCEGTFLEYENIPQSNTERGMTLMKLELTFSDLCQLALVIIALIELFRDRKHKKK